MPLSGAPPATGEPPIDGDEPVACPGLRPLLNYFLSLGALGFGGPIVLAERMDRDLVQQRRWISKADYLEGLAFAQLSPGPLAAQLAVYLGWLCGGRLSAVVIGTAFILPSLLLVLGLAILYVHFGRLAWIQSTFYGIGAAVIAIIAQSALRLVRRTVGRDWLLWLIFAGVAGSTIVTEREIVWLFVACGALSLAIKAPPRLVGRQLTFFMFIPLRLLLTGVRGAASGSTLYQLFVFFSKAGAFVFGSGLAIVPFLYGGVVRDFHWLSDRQFLDAVAVAMITPGPVVITAGFVGYLVAGLLGALAACVAVFAPPFLIVLAGAPYYRRFARNPQVKAFVQGVTAAAVGAIAGAAVVLGRRAIVDLSTVVIAVLTVAALVFLKRIPQPLLIIVAGIAGLLLHGFK